jgi:hypothetical protein
MLFLKPEIPSKRFHENEKPNLFLKPNIES